MEHHPYAEVIRSAGFVRLRGRSRNAAWRLAMRLDRIDPGLVKPILEDARAAIHITLGDSELV